MLFELEIRIKYWLNYFLERLGLSQRIDFRDLKDEFDLERSRQYWKFAPSGYGKVDTAKLLKMRERKFTQFWEQHAQSISQYYWEDRYINGFFYSLFNEKKCFRSAAGSETLRFSFSNTVRP